MWTTGTLVKVVLLILEVVSKITGILKERKDFQQGQQNAIQAVLDKSKEDLYYANHLREKFDNLSRAERDKLHDDVTEYRD